VQWIAALCHGGHLVSMKVGQVSKVIKKNRCGQVADPSWHFTVMPTVCFQWLSQHLLFLITCFQWLSRHLLFIVTCFQWLSRHFSSSRVSSGCHGTYSSSSRVSSGCHGTYSSSSRETLSSRAVVFHLLRAI
jgi:hypothetical protein